ncbi:mevalonate kinase, partial [Candidatus Gottesmanbacteria bacterium]|nr:mevalonate kinase [Candidatus Gottesmanbacteria bacterium]
TIKAPGKLMILGEHAVLYGYSCLVTAVNKYLTVEASFSGSGKDEIITPHSSDQTFIRQSLAYFRKAFAIDKFFRIKTKSEITGYGLGSSSATVVATIKALIYLLKINLTEQKLFDICFRIVLIVQKKASGFDIASCIYGGNIMFSGQTKIAEKISSNPLPISVVFTGVKADTKTMIGQVAETRNKNPQKTDEIFKEIDHIVKMGQQAILGKNWQALGLLMNQNQILLKDLGVSTSGIDKLVDTALQNGAYGAKLSGAGGGDCIIVLANADERTRIEDALQKAGGEIINLSTSVEGTKII